VGLRRLCGVWGRSSLAFRTLNSSCGRSFLGEGYLTTPARGATRVAFQAGAVADQGEVAAFAAAVAFVALHAGGADAVEAEVFGRHWREGEGAVDVGVGKGGECRGAAGTAVEDGQFVAYEAVRGGAAHQVRFGLALTDRVGDML